MKDYLQRQLNERYWAANRAYKSPGVHEVALIVGIGHREYCDRFVRENYPPLTWTALTTDTWQPDADAAYREATS